MQDTPGSWSLGQYDGSQYRLRDEDRLLGSSTPRYIPELLTLPPHLVIFYISVHPLVVLVH